MPFIIRIIVWMLRIFSVEYKEATMRYKTIKKPRGLRKFTLTHEMISKYAGIKLMFYTDTKGNQYVMWNSSYRRYNEDGSFSTRKIEEWRKAVLE